MMQIIFLLFLQTRANDSIKDVVQQCQQELGGDFFPISCYRYGKVKNAPTRELFRVDQACQRWAKNQNDLRLLNKVKKSELVSLGCKNNVDRQQDILRYRDAVE